MKEITVIARRQQATKQSLSIQIAAPPASCGMARNDKTNRRVIPSPFDKLRAGSVEGSFLSLRGGTTKQSLSIQIAAPSRARNDKIRGRVIPSAPAKAGSRGI